MKIVCPHCRTAYDVKPAALGAHGRQVRCARCKMTWTAEPPRLAANVIPLHAQDARIVPPAAGTPTVGQAGPIPPVPGPTLAPADAPAATAAMQAETADVLPVAEARPTASAEAATVAAAPSEPPPSAPHPGTAEPAPPATADVTAADTVIPADTPAEPASPDAAAIEAVDIESAAVRRLGPRRVRRRTKPAWRSQGLVAAILLLVVINAGLILGRTQVVRALPQTASLFEIIGLPVNLRDLAFKDIKTTQELHDGVTILVIEGNIIATGHEPADVPRLRFSIGAANGHEIYAWTALPTRTKLAPGEMLPFRTRLASPPEQGRTVQVRFFTRQDLVSGLR